MIGKSENQTISTLCSLCPNACYADRRKEPGACGEKAEMRIAKYALHPYEEPVISSGAGAGAVFFCGCSLKCVFCQNYEVSRSMRGKVFSPKELADVFKKLEDDGATNIDLVSPTHFVEEIIKALSIYRPRVPVVYNTHGYESVETLKKIDEFVDVYLPDVKFFSPQRASRYCGKTDYFEKCIKAIEFMLSSKRTKVVDGVMKSGVIIRHLVLPQNLDETFKILETLRPIIADGYLSLMAQYTPFGNIEGYPELQRKLTRREYDRAKNKMFELAFEKVFTQDFSSATEKYIPTWDL